MAPNAPLPRTRLSIIIAAMAMVLVAPWAHACQVPVFRYALERWRADIYEVLVLHSGPLTAGDDERLKGLMVRDINATGESNVEVRAMDAADVADPELIKLWEKHSPDGKPIMIVVYPRQALDVAHPVAWVAPFDDASVKQLIDSPVRREIARRILAGDSAVWVFIPCSDEARNAAAMAKLTEQLDANQKELKLPPREVIESDEFFQKDNVVELRLGFSILTVKRDDPAERFLLRSLLRGEPDLETLDQPIVYPVIGRGRALYAVVGDGINDDVIAQACSFIVGPCSCQVKDQNPGFDVLMSVLWDDAISGSAIPDRPAPELTGLSALAPPSTPDATTAPLKSDAQLADASRASSSAVPGVATHTPPSPGAIPPAAAPPVDAPQPAADAPRLLRNIGIVAVVGLTVILIGTLLIKRRGDIS